VYFSALHRNSVLVVQHTSVITSVRRDYSTFFTQGMLISYKIAIFTFCQLYTYQLQSLGSAGV